jgi:hypothetical protein
VLIVWLLKTKFSVVLIPKKQQGSGWGGDT